MANERDDEQFGNENSEFGKDGQPSTGQQGQQSEFGQQNQQAAGQQGQQSEFAQQQQQPTGQQGQSAEFAQDQTQNQGQSSSGQAEWAQDGDTGTLSSEADPNFGGQSPGGSSGASGAEGGFVGSQGTGSDEYLQEQGSDGGSDFASQGQGALDQDEDVETGQSQDRDSDIEGSSGNIESLPLR
jgi:hypothetical protein